MARGAVDERLILLDPCDGFLDVSFLHVSTIARCCAQFNDIVRRVLFHVINGINESELGEERERERESPGGADYMEVG